MEANCRRILGFPPERGRGREKGRRIAWSMEEERPPGRYDGEVHARGGGDDVSVEKEGGGGGEPPAAARLVLRREKGKRRDDVSWLSSRREGKESHDHPSSKGGGKREGGSGHLPCSRSITGKKRADGPIC